MTAAQSRVDFGGIFRPQGQLDEATALAPYHGALNERLAAHLLRRAGFGGAPDDVRRYAAMSVNDAVESFVRFPDTSQLPGPENVFDPAPILAQYGPRGLRALTDSQKRELYRTNRMAGVASTLSMQMWWMNRMLTTPAPLQEKMALLFHGHFTTACMQKSIFPTMSYAQNQLFRSYALGNVRELARAVSKDPALNVYLDNEQNVKEHPNENFAREFMELFTLGVGNYTEDDVRESARAWTGYRFNRVTLTASYDPSRHDDGMKTFLGRTGNFNGDDVVNIIFQQPASARFFAAFLLNSFVYNDPEPALVDEVAALIRKHDFELAPVVSTILRSNVFYSDRAYRALVKSPVEFVVGTYKTLGLPHIDDSVGPVVKNMGQWLFIPPNVAGWPGGENWLTSNAMIVRQNFLKRTVTSQAIAESSWLRTIPMQARAAAAALIGGILQDDATPASIAQLHGYLSGAGTSALAALTPENYDERVSGAAYLTLAMPAYQLG
jgi:uncharacterized protein (DUF1800 family)